MGALSFASEESYRSIVAKPSDPIVRELTTLAPFPFPAALGEVLVQAYGEGRRAYHTLAHVLEVARQLEVARALAPLSDLTSVFLAVLFHDAVYDATAKDNEARSAELLEETVRALDLGLPTKRAKELVIATASHGTIDPGTDADLALFLDADMAILGAPIEAYDAYEAGVAYEYAEAYPGPLYRAGRAAFLEKLLAKPRLFFTATFHRWLDASARANLRRALESLRAANM